MEDFFMNAENQLLRDDEIKIKASAKSKTYENEGSSCGYVNLFSRGRGNER